MEKVREASCGALSTAPATTVYLPRSRNWARMPSACFPENLTRNWPVSASPYLVRLREGTPFLSRWRSEGWGKAWGILFRSDANMETLRRFFRQHLEAELPDGRRVLFRFYDPRVVQKYSGNGMSTINGGVLPTIISYIDQPL